MSEIRYCHRCIWVWLPRHALARCVHPAVGANSPALRLEPNLSAPTAWARTAGPCGPDGLQFWPARRKVEQVYPWTYGGAFGYQAGQVAQALAALL